MHQQSCPVRLRHGGAFPAQHDSTEKRKRSSGRPGRSVHAEAARPASGRRTEPGPLICEGHQRQRPAAAGDCGSEYGDLCRPFASIGMNRRNSRDQHLIHAQQLRDSHLIITRLKHGSEEQQSGDQYSADSRAVPVRIRSVRWTAAGRTGTPVRQADNGKVASAPCTVPSPAWCM